MQCLYAVEVHGYLSNMKKQHNSIFSSEFGVKLIIICLSKTGQIMGTPMVGSRRCPCPLLSSNGYCLIMKLGETVNGHYISAKFNNQPKGLSRFRVMALYLEKNGKFALSTPSNSCCPIFIKMFMGISWPSSITT